MSSIFARLGFQFMVAVFRLRDWRRPRREVLREVGIQPGFLVLDFGCGTGSYIPETARLVRDDVLQELHRVLRPGGILSVSDHHLTRADIVNRVASGSRFRFTDEGAITISLARAG